MNKQIEDISCKRCVHYEVCRFVNALAVANVVNAENCRMFKDTKGYRKASQEGAECPTCHGTGRIGTTDWLTKGISEEQLAKEKAEAVTEHEAQFKRDVAREIFSEIEKILSKSRERYSVGGYHYDHYKRDNAFVEAFAELKKKYESEERE